MEISLSPTKGFRNCLVIYKNQSTEEKERHRIYGAKTFVVKGNVADRDVQFVRIFEGTAEREKTIIGGVGLRLVEVEVSRYLAFWIWDKGCGSV